MEIRSVITSQFRQDFDIHDKADFDPENATEEVDNAEQYAMLAGERKATDIFSMHSKKKYYLYIKANIFKENICSWHLFLDSYVRRANIGSSYFCPITYERDFLWISQPFSGPVASSVDADSQIPYKRRRPFTTSVKSPMVFASPEIPAFDGMGSASAPIVRKILTKITVLQYEIKTFIHHT